MQSIYKTSLLILLFIQFLPLLKALNAFAGSSPMAEDQAQEAAAESLFGGSNNEEGGKEPQKGPNLAPRRKAASDGSANAEHALGVLQLRVGQTYPLEGFTANQYTILPPGIVMARETAEGLSLVGQKPGTTRFTAQISGKSITLPIQVKASSQDEGGANVNADGLLKALGELRKTPGIRISTFNGKSLVEGEILGRPIYQKLLTLEANYPGRITNLAITAPGIKASLMEQAIAALHSQGMKHVEIASAGNRFFLYGSVSNPIEVEQALEAVLPLLPTTENRLPIPIHIEPTVTVRVYLLELSRHAHNELGLGWSLSQNPIARISPLGSAFSTAWDVTLKHLYSKGLARVLAEPMLSVKMGSTAELVAGGEFPIKLTEKFENRVVWRHYGLKLRISIGGIAGNRIRSRIETESSQLDSATAVGGIPGIRENRLSTEIDAIEGEPVLLTGLFQSAAAKDVEKLPILGELPLIGELFKSRDFRSNESELLIALCPTLETVRTKLPLRGVRGIDEDTRWSIQD